ncbi:MAG: hypothetical protein QW706_09740 [Candidatus Nezhaarchaeales archaeon]
MELPEDVKELLEKLKRRGYEPSLVAVEREEEPDKYDAWREGKYYLGVLKADDVYKERNLVVCDKLVCACFIGHILRYAWQRKKRELYEPEEW